MLEKICCKFCASLHISSFSSLSPCQWQQPIKHLKTEKKKQTNNHRDNNNNNKTSSIAPRITIWNIFINVLFETCPTQWNRCLKSCIFQCISLSQSFWTCIYMPTRLHKFHTGLIIAQINDATRKELSCFQSSNNHVRGAVGMKMIELHLFSEIFSGMNHPLHNI